MKRNYKKLAAFLAVMILTLSFASSGFAANTVANLKATYRNITVYKNGMLFNFSKEPFIVDGTTYVPLRDMAEMVDKDVTWDGVSYKIGVNDKPGQNVVELSQQIFNQQLTISQLEAKIKNLESQLDEKEEDSISLKDLAKDLLKEYDEINKYLEVVDIKLKGDEDDIDVEIYLDLDDDDDLWEEWEDLTDKEIQKFLQKIVDDILDVKEYEDADIVGFIEDKDSRSELRSFEIDKKGKVVLD
ncbi:stalk domain-containing protein [Tissierella sp. Yu-01]|uniref:stalk domain-containing protein n=1 Tax=Tissierella sp. Yu-01 TaxID=3035694 RepID=UPI00240E4D7B|nr:stalk domain-containing protein [Tissierella sp. Yu-01]WFA08528.1 stalk domain-containing protein [Tissierella sp. Yu-01]